MFTFFCYRGFRFQSAESAVSAIHDIGPEESQNGQDPDSRRLARMRSANC